MVGHDRDGAGADLLEKIAVGDKAKALIPGVVARREMLLDIVVGTELRSDHAEQNLLDLLGLRAGAIVGETLELNILETGDRVGPLLGHDLPQEDRDLIDGGSGYHVSGGALDHGHVLGILRHIRHDGYGGCATADHGDALVCVVETFGPELRIDDLTFEVVCAFELGAIAVFIVVVARAHHQKVALDVDGFVRVLAQDLERPLLVFARPSCAFKRVLEADVFTHAVLVGGLVHVVSNRSAVGDRLAFFPGLEGKAKGMHVTVGAYAGIAEEVPGAADRVAPFEERVGLARAMVFEVAGCTDSGQAGTNDDDVEGFHEFSGGRGCAPTGAGARGKDNQ